MNVELKFYHVYNEKYGTGRINIEKGFLSSKEVKEHCKILKIDDITKYGYRKADVQLEPDKCLLIESWETQINKFLRGQGIITPIKILYGNKIYPKTKISNPAKASIIKIKNIWIIDKGKPFPQLWLE